MKKYLLFRDNNGKVWVASSQYAIQKFLEKREETIAIFIGELQISLNKLERVGRGVYIIKNIGGSDE